ncbi:RNA-splicing ligase RtcB [Candidatus Kaiserbacteria bacterium RIFCSPHIGHO2_01_FULL_55_17]|uniref:tRNA-splicing ligase RtcB n=1 Tax=Candidatus Kaiserbacteria bacterium RIFCSPHIGHO2_01_FULL_55_17 TaxID=1798484 RepID=A0A1F6D7N7_9BACT|nr:MAG: RNA-splicing ligase RtcB [Candidatus Kaiserbacteria bacterium RIFCSPHIGHO2_01_FULL_55_17]
MDISRLKKIEEYLWEIPKSARADMRVPARVYATQKILEDISEDKSLEQLMNVATLPGIVGYALAMPDVHEGYGFPVGGVAAFDIEKGIISPGGIGYDINCGVRLLLSKRTREEIAPLARDLGRTIFAEVPSGVGRGGRLKLTKTEFDEVLLRGAQFLREKKYASDEDIAHIESGGRLPDADPARVSERARARGVDQLGTIGAGNHFVEVEYVSEIYDGAEAKRLGLSLDQVCILIHTGSRGLGHQVATDYIREMNLAMPRYGIELPDRELACAPFKSPEGQAYWHAMSAAANFAWANRQMITWEVRKAWQQVTKERDDSLTLLYDVAHNIAKVEEYVVGKRRKKVVVHRKGATRAFPDQPVIIPGSMGTGSCVLLGQEGSLAQSFGSSCHGAGRRMSRHRARAQIGAKELRKQLEAQGVVVNAGSRRGLTEEAPFAYKDLEEVVGVIHDAGIAKRIARLRPMAVIKG